MRKLRSTLLLAAVLALPATATAQFSSIASNFNGTAIAPGSSIWFNAVFKVNGSPGDPFTVQFTGGTITFGSYTAIVPNAVITFASGTTLPTLAFTGGQWVESLPSPGTLSGNEFLSGVAFYLPSGLPGGTNPVTWSGTFTSSNPGVDLDWKWGAAVYTCFNNPQDYNALNVKPTDEAFPPTYPGSHHAGTPEAYTSGANDCVTGGARGGGGSNFTGSYSATKSVNTGEIILPPDPEVVPEPQTVVLMATGLAFLGLAVTTRRRIG